jgi:hypothetical protein
MDADQASKIVVFLFQRDQPVMKLGSVAKDS